jgi:hypothetical protein
MCENPQKQMFSIFVRHPNPLQNSDNNSDLCTIRKTDQNPKHYLCFSYNMQGERDNLRILTAICIEVVKKYLMRVYNET